MNRAELKRGAQWLRDNVPPDRFDMGRYRSKGLRAHICNSIGCAVGWLVGSVSEEEIDKWRDRSWSIEFYEWSSSQYSLTPYEWAWCFDEDWVNVDNTIEGAALRMEWLVEHGLPENWESQIEGNAPLVYAP